MQLSPPGGPSMVTPVSKMCRGWRLTRVLSIREKGEQLPVIGTVGTLAGSDLRSFRNQKKMHYYYDSAQNF